MIIDITELKTGEELVIKMLIPPLFNYANKVECWNDIREELLGGQMARWLFAPYFVGEIDGEVVGSMSYFTPADTRDIGLVEFVNTAEKHRGKGVASALLAKLIERFRIDRGLVLYLCTNNPIAGMLYEKHGFWYNVGDGMRNVTFGAEDFDKSYLAFYGTARVRDATWGDLPRASALYNHPEPQWFIKDYLTHSFRDTRFESHFVKLMRRIENKRGALLVLENHKQRVVGVAAIERFDTFYEQHVALLSFRVCPSYFEQASELLNAIVRKARELSITTIQTYIADCDDEQIQLVKKAGFSYEARLRNRLRNEDRLMDLLVYTLLLPGTARPLRSKGDYYGGRKQWQAERIASS
jgi:GNAT superfamily N-acetyltransferase